MADLITWWAFQHWEGRRCGVLGLLLWWSIVPVAAWLLPLRRCLLPLHLAAAATVSRFMMVDAPRVLSAGRGRWYRFTFDPFLDKRKNYIIYRYV